MNEMRTLGSSAYNGMLLQFVASTFLFRQSWV